MKRYCATALSLCLLVPVAAPSAALAAIQATTADDVCAPTEDPCNVTDVIEIQSTATLNFGTRTVNVIDGGQFDFGYYRGTVLAGNINVDPFAGRTGIKVRRSSGGEFVGGDATLVARRGCSLDPSTPCLVNATCAVLSLGTCSSGPAGTMLINGKVAGNGTFEPAFIQLQAAGDVTINKLVEASATGVDADSGLIEITSEQGSVFVNSPITAKGGGASTGGDFEIDAAVDLVINAILNASSTSGEDAEGGFMELISGRDILINDDVDADGGSFSGGEICIDAGRDLIVNGIPGKRTTVQASGTTFIDEFNDATGGDGGFLDLLAGNDIVFGEFTKIEADGAQPDGDGSDISLATDEGDIEIAGQMFSRANGNDGAGGVVSLDADRNVVILPTADIDVGAGNGGAGDVDFFARGDVDIQAGASIDASAGNLGKGGSFTSNSTRTFLNSQIKVDGTPRAVRNGDVDIEGCELFVESGAKIVNGGGAGITTLTGRDVIATSSITVASGAEIDTSGTDGVNKLIYIAASKPPSIDAGATVDPSPTLIVNAALSKCPGCGNGQTDAGETCDDGNFLGGDGCSADCQLETCIAQSIGYPAQPLCNDNNGCTVDTCNVLTGDCEHVLDCNDGVACTVDECVGSQCVSTPTDALCDDSNTCTDETCSAVTGCISVNNLADCDDGSFCNGMDGCSGGLCKLHGGNPCNGAPECGAGLCDEAGGACLPSPAGTACSDDGNVCTDDMCDGAGSCVHPDNTAPCDDGVACTQGDICAGGVCTAGVPNDGLCNDANICTDDTCQVGTGCTSANNTDPCDDGEACTINDTCVGGMCTGTPQNCAGVCGDGILNDGEDCDDGPANGTVGNACDNQCGFNECGQPTGSQSPVATDSLYVLQAGVGIGACAVCICDVTGDGQVNASDALAVLRRSVGLPIPFSCPPCA